MADLSPRNLKRAGGAVAISAVIVGAAVALAIWASGDAGEPVAAPGVAPTTIDYVAYDGPDELFEAHAGRPLVINFFASWCAPCRAELPDLAAAHAEFGDRVAFLGVDFQEVSEESAARLLFETGITYPIAEDPDGVLLQEIGTLPTMPTTVFVTAAGEVLERHHGIILADQLAERIEEIIGAP
ncbi:MAG: TlpA family protein disulfide reductase [Acidimicrobiia bacterium]|nr:TlpA family protein disulfide reductase [Acidimicrobiia bacterium]NNL70958.1 TlpA family protein disulfide reductase [Acidimicrobiia bacterium]